MNHKLRAKDHYETGVNARQGDIETRHMARAQYHLGLAQLEALDAIVALLTKQSPTITQNFQPFVPMDGDVPSRESYLSIEELREELSR